MENSNSINKPPSCSPNVRIFALNYSPTNDFNRIFDFTWLSLGRSVEHSNNTKCNFRTTRPNTFQKDNDRSSRRDVTSNDRYFAAVIEPASEIIKEPVLAQFIRCGWKIQRRELLHGYAYYKYVLEKRRLTSLNRYWIFWNQTTWLFRLQSNIFLGKFLIKLLKKLWY